MNRTLPGKRFTLQPQAGNSPFCYRLNLGFAKYPFLFDLWKKKTTGKSLFALFRRIIIPSGLKNDSPSCWNVLFLQTKSCNGGIQQISSQQSGKLSNGTVRLGLEGCWREKRFLAVAVSWVPSRWAQLALAAWAHSAVGHGDGEQTHHQEVEMSWLGDLGATQDVALLENGMNSRLAQDRLCRPVRVLYDYSF